MCVCDEAKAVQCSLEAIVMLAKNTIPLSNMCVLPMKFTLFLSKIADDSETLQLSGVQLTCVSSITNQFSLYSSLYVLLRNECL